MRNILIVSMVTLVLLYTGCVPYLVGVAVTSRNQANARVDCAENGGEYVDGSSWGWSSGRCIMPADNINVTNLTPAERCVHLGGTYSAEEAKCNFSPEQECAALGGIYYASTGACDLRNVDATKKSVNVTPEQECAALGGIYYASTGACDLRNANNKKDSVDTPDN